MSATKLFTLYTPAQLKTKLGKMGVEVANITLSLAYHTTIHGNSSALTNCDKSISNLLDPVYRQFISAKHNGEVWKTNTERSKKLCADLQLEHGKATFEAFCTAVLSSNAAKEAAKAAEKAAENALTPEQKTQAEKDRVLAYLVKSGLTELQLRDLVLQVERERSKNDKKASDVLTASVKASAANGSLGPV